MAEENEENEAEAANEAEAEAGRIKKQMARVADRLENLKLAEYIELLNSPVKFFWINFLAGIARGVGFALGMTVLAAIILYFLQQLMVLNLPVIGDFIAEIVKIVQEHL